jgi:hypothetical protein
MSEIHTIASAAADLGDEYATQISACIEVLKTEADLAKRRVAQSRYLDLQAHKERRAA